MDDRKLLELAAKAAGFNGLVYCEFWECMAEFVNEDGGYFDSETCWNPLHNDGDALRLTVKLKIDVKQYDDHVVGWFDGGYVGTGEIPYDGDPYAATRHAIVLAAAEIGKDIK